jgi:hypothetical protein
MKRSKPMLNGLWVDFDKIQGLICKEVTHNLDYELIHLKYRDSIVKVAL